MAELYINNQIIKRSLIHDQYGGSRQSGISASAKYPYIFIFTGTSGHQYGYKDGWDNANVFSYTGEGQTGDMTFIKGNLALRNHLENGKRVFLFEYQQKGIVKYISEVELFDVDYFETHDTNNRIRIAIRFFFKRKGTYLPVEQHLINTSSVLSEPKEGYEINIPNETERKGFVTSRVGQGAYRKRIIHRWEYKCAVTGFDKLNLLIASHILPWSNSNDNERLDVDNGILLSPTYDALFDRHLISFENSGKIILSDNIEKQAYQKIGVTGNEKIQNLSSHNHDYLERHRNMFLKTS